MVKYLKKEDSLIVWTTALSHLWSWKELLQETPSKDKMDKFMLSLLDPIYQKLKWEDTGSHVERLCCLWFFIDESSSCFRLLRQKILSAAIDVGHKEVVAKAKEEFKQLVENKAHVSANLQKLVYSVGIKTGSKEDWDWCFKKYKTTKIPSDRGQLLTALGDSKDIFVLQGFD